MISAPSSHEQVATVEFWRLNLHTKGPISGPKKGFSFKINQKQVNPFFCQFLCYLPLQISKK